MKLKNIIIKNLYIIYNMSLNIFIILFLIQQTLQIIKLKFETDQISIINEDKLDLQFLLKNDIFTKFQIGNPYQEIKCYIKTLLYDFYIIEQNKKGFYSKNNSNTYYTTSKEISYFHDSNYKKGYYCFENFNFLNEKNEYFEISNFSTLLVENINEKNYPCFIGLSYRDISNDYHRNFFQSLIMGKIIKSINYSIEYLNENEGEIIIGKLPHEYNKKYKEKDLKWIQVNFDNYSSDWKIKFNKIEIGNEIFNGSNIGIFIYENNMIFGPNEYKEKFLKNIFDKNKCFEFRTINGYYYYKCDESVALNNLPEISFKSYDLNYTFVLNKNDLIKKINNTNYLMIYFSDYSNFIWKLGKPFLKKYKFIFEHDKRIIGFYNKENLYDNKKIFSYFLIFLCFFIIIILSFILFKLSFKKRKKRSNEIEDMYEYIPEEKI